MPPEVRPKDPELRHNLLGMTEAQLTGILVSIGGVLGTFIAPKNAE
jgi:hypothetical protein